MGERDAGSVGSRRRVLRAAAVAGVAGAAALLGGCAVWRPAVVPMRTIRLDAPCSGARTLLVFLPGSYSYAEDFATHGFVAEVRRRGVAADVLLVDAHLGYYSERSILERLEDDVMAPARAKGYDAIWLVGISVGAFGAMAFAASGGEGVAGIVAMAPYLGDRRVAISVEASGGLAAWPAPAYPLPPNETDQKLWDWLQAATRPVAAGALPSPLRPSFPELWLATGADDRFAFAQGLLGTALPPGRRVVRPGGHDWPTWEALWRETLPRLPLPARGDCAGAVAASASGR